MEVAIRSAADLQAAQPAHKKQAALAQAQALREPDTDGESKRQLSRMQKQFKRLVSSSGRSAVEGVRGFCANQLTGAAAHLGSRPTATIRLGVGEVAQASLWKMRRVWEIRRVWRLKSNRKFIGAVVAVRGSLACTQTAFCTVGSPQGNLPQGYLETTRKVPSSQTCIVRNIQSVIDVSPWSQPVLVESAQNWRARGIRRAHCSVTYESCWLTEAHAACNRI
jgi:hypothetical protein